jgi:hypothetical protein
MRREDVMDEMLDGAEKIRCEILDLLAEEHEHENPATVILALSALLGHILKDTDRTAPIPLAVITHLIEINRQQGGIPVVYL